MFGDVEKYFSKGDFTTFRNGDKKFPKQWNTAVASQDASDATSGLHLWNLEVTQITVNSQEHVRANKGKPIHAFFDSTSSFIFTHNDILTELVNLVNRSQ